MRTPSQRGDGWFVRYRINGRHTSQPFETEAEALKFCIDLDEYGAPKAEQLLYDRLAEIEEAVPTLDAWMDELIPTMSVSPGTRTKYRSNYDLHVSGMLGSLPVTRIGPGDAARLVIELSEKKNLRDKTVANIFTPFAIAMDIAHKRGLIASNPCAETRMPRRTGHLKEETAFLTQAEFASLRSHFTALDENGHPLTRSIFLPLIDFAAGTGARWGECAALTVRDIDYLAGTVRINKAMKDDGTVGPPKTPRSIRTVHFPAEIVPTLRLATDGKRPNDLVFTMPRGGQLRHRTFSTRYWIPAMLELDLVDPRPGFHSLRHSHASWLLAEGVTIPAVSRRLGHASIQITVDTYGHLEPAVMAEAGQVAGRVFAGSLGA